MGKEIDILFYIEHYEREIEVYELIKNTFKDKKIVRCSTIFEMGLSKLRYNPKLIITPWMYDNRDYELITSFLLKKDIKLLNLHHEQITNQDRAKALLPKDLAREGYHISWGKDFTEQLLKCGISKDHIFETGSIRLDQAKVIKFTREELVKSLGLNIELDKKWILFISSYSWKNLSNKNLQQIEKRGRKNVMQYKKIVEKSYSETLYWIEMRLKKNKDIEFIYRLHPSEAIDEKLMKLQEKYYNFHVIKDFELKEWIYNSDEIELWISTGIAEVITLDKPFRIIRPIKLEKNVEIDGFNCFNKISTLDDYLNNFNGEKNLVEGKKYLLSKYNLEVNVKQETINSIHKIIDSESFKLKSTELRKWYIVFREILKDLLKIGGTKLKLKFINKINKISKEYRVFYGNK